MATNYNEQLNSHHNSYMQADLGSSNETALPVTAQFDFSPLRAKVDEIINQGFNDMWLLLDGEAFETDYASGVWRDGKPFAMVTGSQISLLSPKFSAVNALLSVGVTMQ